MVQTRLWWGRVTSTTLLNTPLITVKLAVQHVADKGCPRDHIHYVIETSLSYNDKKNHEALNKCVRESIPGLARNDIMWKHFEFDLWLAEGPTGLKGPMYVLDHCGPQVRVVTNDFKPDVDAALAALQKAKEDKERMEEERRQLEIKAFERDREVFHEKWGFYPEDLPVQTVDTYRALSDRLNQISTYWACEHPTWSFREYCNQVVTWLADPANKDYKAMYSEYRLRGDVKLLYARNWNTRENIEYIAARMFGPF